MSDHDSTDSMPGGGRPHQRGRIYSSEAGMQRAGLARPREESTCSLAAPLPVHVVRALVNMPRRAGLLTLFCLLAGEGRCADFGQGPLATVSKLCGCQLRAAGASCGVGTCGRRNPSRVHAGWRRSQGCQGHHEMHSRGRPGRHLRSVRLPAPPRSAVSVRITRRHGRLTGLPAC